MVSGAPELSKVARVRFWIGRAGSRATISPVEIGQQRFAPDQARIGRQHRSQGLGDRRGRLGRQRGVEAAGELARAHVDLERRRLQGAHPLRIQVLARQVRQEDEEETRGDGPRDAGPRPREAPKDK